MNPSHSGFTLVLSDAQRNERFEQVARFIGADGSGAFGVLAHHAPMVAVLRYGLARFADARGQWQYLALPGGVLHFRDNTLTLLAERYFRGDARERIVACLADEMAREDSELQNVRATLAEIERALIRRLSALSASLGEGGRP